MSDQLTFDLDAGTAARDAGMALASMNRAELLLLARRIVRSAAMRRVDRTATADDASEGLAKLGYSADALGNAAGSVFRGKEWTFAGFWKASRRVTNHGHENRVWRLSDGGGG